MEMDTQKQNGSSVQKEMKDFIDSDQEETGGRIKVLVHQDAIDIPEDGLPKKDFGSGERSHLFLDSKPLHKLCPSEVIEPDDIITPLSEESSPTAPDQHWEEKPSMDVDDMDSESCFQNLFPCCGGLMDSSTMTIGRFLGVVTCFVFYVGNIISDIMVCYHLFLHGNMLWFALASAFTIIPTVILNTISYHLSITKMIVKRSIWNQSESLVVSVVIAVLHLAQFGIVARYLGYIFLHELEYLWVVFCPLKKRKHFNHRNGKYVELPYIPYLFIVEAILQCLPQLIVQLYILIEGQGALASDTNHMLIISIFVSLLNLSRLLTLCKHIQKNCTTTWCGLVLVYLWYFFSNISRVVSFTLFLTKFVWGFTMLCLFHWIIMSLWAVSVLTPSVPCKSWNGFRKNCIKYLKGLLYGIMYILCFMKLDIEEDSDDSNIPTRYLYAFFYSVIFLENTVVSVLWFIYTVDVWYHIPATVLNFTSFFLGIFFMCAYYRHFHKNVINHSQRWKLVMLFPVRNHD